MTDTTTTISLLDKLVVLNAEQYQAVFAIYGQPGLDKYDTLVKGRQKPIEFQNSLNEFIQNDENQEQKTKLIQVIERYYDDYKNEKGQLDNLTQVAKQAAKAKNDFKKIFNMTIATFTKSFESMVSEEMKAQLDHRKLEDEANKAYEKREKMRKTGKRAYLRGLVSAVIDECEKEYKAEVEKEAKTIIEVAKALAVEVENSKSEEGTKEIMSLAFPKEDKKLISTEAARTAAAAAAAGNLNINSKDSPTPAGSNGKGFGNK